MPQDLKEAIRINRVVLEKYERARLELLARRAKETDLKAILALESQLNVNGRMLKTLHHAVDALEDQLKQVPAPTEKNITQT